MYWFQPAAYICERALQEAFRHRMLETSGETPFLFPWETAKNVAMEPEDHSNDADDAAGVL